MAAQLHSFNFGVKIDKNTNISFQELSGLGREVEIETYQEGGRNDSVLLFPKKAGNAGSITMKKGVFTGSEPPFYLVGETLNHLTVEVYGMDCKTIMKTYLLENLVITKWEISAMNAQNNELLINSFALSYGNLRVL